MKQENIKQEGIIVNDLSNGIFEIDLLDKDGEPIGHTVRGTIGGKLRMHNIRLNVQDRVTLELSPYDLNLGRIIFRHAIDAAGVVIPPPRDDRRGKRSGKGKRR